MTENKLELRPMTAPEFSDFIEKAISKFAGEKQKNEGLTAEQAMKVAQETYGNLLPKGLESPDQFLYAVVDKSSKNSVGRLWYTKKMNGDRVEVFIYNIEVWEDQRGQGFSGMIMDLMEQEARKIKCVTMRLHVFGKNDVALAAWTKKGFLPTNIMMKKDLS